MRKFLSERNLVIVLFIVALVVFSFAQADAHKLDEQQKHAGAYQVEMPVEATLAEQAVPSRSSAARD